MQGCLSLNLVADNETKENIMSNMDEIYFEAPKNKFSLLEFIDCDLMNTIDRLDLILDLIKWIYN